MTGWGQSFKELLNLFLESSCPLCQRTTPAEFCHYCQRRIQQCQFPNPAQLWSQAPVFAWGSYSGTLKQAIAALKYENQRQLARPLGHWLAQAWLNSPLSTNDSGSKLRLTVVPIPIHADRQQQRGYNQAELLAQSFCEFTGLPLQRYGLERIRPTKAQFGLSATERQQNLTGAFRLGKGLHQRHASYPVLLLDDIYTTGATACSAMQTLKAHGISTYGLVAVARTQQIYDVL